MNLHHNVGIIVGLLSYFFTPSFLFNMDENSSVFVLSSFACLETSTPVEQRENKAASAEPGQGCEPNAALLHVVTGSFVC